MNITEGSMYSIHGKNRIMYFLTLNYHVNIQGYIVEFILLQHCF